MPSITSLPTECLWTCKHLHSIYVSNKYSVLGKIGPRDIPAFDDAVIAVRATRIVLESFDKCHFPPDPFPFDCLSLEAQTPSLDDIRLRENFRRAMYRSFLMGAVLCRAYQEPLSPLKEDDDRPQDFLKDAKLRIDDPDAWLITRDEMAYLLKYPSEHHSCEPALLSMYPEDATPRDLDLHHARVLYAEIVQCLLMTMAFLNPNANTQFFEDASHDTRELDRKVTIIPLGSFYPERISMPNNPHKAHKTLLVKQPVPHPQKTGTAWHPSSSCLWAILNNMHAFSGQPNTYGESYPTPPPPLQIFQYIFRTHMGLRFIDFAFEEDGIDSTHRLFVHHPSISRIFVDGWPEEVPIMFDTLGAEEGHYVTSYVPDPHV
ncbi:hypothetical protein BO94DRAFT_569526 [Aspergillus sclerotioniger CBS 115572]|uniref:Uncharacterized protein n=1 Tax=Aspergillus sclerotioniger CBS 115572 TaxID=1450535 RepID=A0A317VAJ1_9EURO|nr:hypothetical protein BO94DRAFT_569526 [Aspergillus sclerotioniger CBS 115572]PWY70311.1 hypothetical protein BO94DRAFT_569526 [Aspergillus sclerotioniger CBS 115572]